MKYPHLPLVTVVFWVIFTRCPILFAATTLEYRYLEGKNTVPQSLAIQGKKAWISSLAGNAQTDLLFDAETGQWTLIQKDKRTFTVFSEKAIRKLSSQIELFAPLVKGVSKQLGDLRPEQQQKWGRLLDNIPVEAIDRLQKHPPKTKVSEGKKSQRIANIPCRSIHVEADAHRIELCLADPGQMELPSEEAKTLVELSNSLQSILRSAGVISAQVGLNISAKELGTLVGLPLSYQETSSSTRNELKFVGMKSSEEALAPPEIPSGFRQEKIKFW